MLPTASKRPVVVGVLLLTCVALGWHGLTGTAKRNVSEYYIHHDHIIGTSLDLWVTAPNADAAAEAEAAILDEIERLRQVFSLYDEASELSRLNRTREPMVVSREMIDVLRQYEAFQVRTHGAFNGQLGELVRVWSERSENRTTRR
jgi:FAD:protein FMN transferase